MPTFLTKSDETILKSIKIDQEILMRKKIVVRLHLLTMLKVDDVGEAFARKSKQRKSKNLPKIRRLHKKQVRSNKDASKGRD